ncbi:MAG: DUF4412 domain-containing protein [Gemmatimonadaceae bacterium]|nr:DUF4412 domain-containing protein [Gemmatimonadaceae bacterium]
MQRAKLCLAAACLLATASTRLAAQGFDGVIQFVSYEDHGDQPDTMTQITKGSKIRFEGMGKGGGAMIMNGSERIILIPEQKAYMEMPMNMAREADNAAAKQHGTATKTGKIENVAGIPCEEWHYKGSDEAGKSEEGDACVAKGAGLMINRLSGGMMAHFFTSGGQAFSEALMNGGGIMKVTSNGKLSFIAVHAQATSVPDAMFSPPPGYTKMDMSHMGRPRKP